MSVSGSSQISHPSEVNQSEPNPTSQADQSPKSSWFGGIFSTLGKFAARFSFATSLNKDYSQVEKTETPLASLAPSAEGKPTVKAKWGFLTSLYNWACGNSSAGKATIAVESPDGDESTISMSGEYSISDSENLQILNESLQQIKQSAADAETDTERGTFVSEKLEAPFGDNSDKNNNFNASLQKISHQGILAGVTKIFAKGNPPAKACHLVNVENVTTASSVDLLKNKITLTLTVTGKRRANTNTGVCSADTPLALPYGETEPERQPLVFKDRETTGESTTKMHVKGKLNEDGSIDVSSLECLYVQGSWKFELPSSIAASNGSKLES